MYWPLGAPRIFAVNKSRNKLVQRIDEATPIGHDGLEETAILGLRVSRAGHLFATITATALTVWQTSPVAALASVVRSSTSLGDYGTNVSVLFRPDSTTVVLQTSLGFLVTYGISTDFNARVYQQIRQDVQARRQSLVVRVPDEEEHMGQREVHIRFRMVIKIDAGIADVLALDEELVVVTEKPAAIQCIRWPADNAGGQIRTELLSRMAWMNKKSSVTSIIYDRAMSLYVFISNDGKAYAVQKINETYQGPDSTKKMFRGYGFHTPKAKEEFAVKGAINARFSLLAVGCANGEVHVYTARDYVGNIPLSHKLAAPASMQTTGHMTSIDYSLDGYCLFVGFEKGWVIWSVYGKQGGSSFVSDLIISRDDSDMWLTGIQSAHWVTGGSELILTCPNEDRIWILELAKSAVTGCFCAANMSRMLLYTSSSLMLYQGYDLSDLVSISTDPTLWHQVQIPTVYLRNQRPIRSVVISTDGRYVAIAGRRGLAHYSVHSRRWKTFDDIHAENAFVVRGGMCWYQHVLIAATETDDVYELRLYSRELGLNESSLAFVERLPAPVVVMSPVGEDSVLIYTQENLLYHFIITTSNSEVRLVQVGQIGLHGIVRAPTRVRAVTWSIPDYQLVDGDPSQDVAHASVIFLVDAKLVLLQPSKNPDGGLKYDMRVIANNVEYFIFMRDQDTRPGLGTVTRSLSTFDGEDIDDPPGDTGLTESLWYFDGQKVQCWTDFREFLKPISSEDQKDLPTSVAITTDFYPTSIVLRKGIILGIEPDLVQRRDVGFAFFRFTIRTQLFLPEILHQYLSALDSSAALNVSYHYQGLPYFSHILEVLLHTVLDAEVESSPSQEAALLPSILSFLSSFPEYLDILVQCTRKTEVRSWRTLFAYLPPPQELFEESLHRGLLKTAGGYLLVLHTFEELDLSSEHCVRLLQLAKEAGDWELCKELARFLMALDESGSMLRHAMERINVTINMADYSNPPTASPKSSRLQNPRSNVLAPLVTSDDRLPSQDSDGDGSGDMSPGAAASSEDHFSSHSG